jgi:DNA replication protein DnaC
LRSSQFSEDRSDFEQRIEKLINADVVIFDDVGKEKPTGWVQDQYFRIVDGRYNNKKATGFTSNYEFDELEKRFSEFGEAIVSRFISMTRDYAVNIQADDWRRR